MFPGLGQLYLGRRLAALAFAIPALAFVAWAAVQLSGGPLYFAASLLDDTYALTVMVVVAAFTALRAASVAHPFLVARPRRFRLRAGAVLAALLVATVGMSDVVFSNAFDAYNATRQIAANDFADATASPAPSLPSLAPGATAAPTDTDAPLPSDTPVDSPSPGFTCPPSYMSVPRPTSNRLTAVTAVYAPAAVPLLDTPDPGATPTPPGPTPTPPATPDVTPTPSPEITPTPEATPTPEITPTPEATPTPVPTTAPSPSPSASPGHVRMTVLLVGVDLMAGRSHALTDTLMLVSIDLQTRAVAMVSVPRDTAAFPFYWGGQAPDNMKINTLVGAISAGRYGSPDPPMVTLANEIGYLVGVKTDYYAEIDMDGFKKMVDLVGGVDINNPSLLDDPSTCTYVPAGKVHLNGSMALRYVRSRESTNDYYRASRQQLVMVSLQKKMATPAMLPKLGRLLDLAGKSIATNFPLKTVKDYVDAAEHLTSITHCVLGPPYNYHPDSSLTGGSWTSRLRLDQVANLSVQLFGTDSRYYGQAGVSPAACQNRY